MTGQPSTASPRWNSTTKLIVGFATVGLVVFLINRFSGLIPPLLMIFIITYLLHPAAGFLSRNLHLSWKASVNIIYLFIIVVVIGLLTLGSVGLVGQTQNLVHSTEGIVTDLPNYISELSTQVFVIGPFVLDMQTFDLTDIANRLLAYIEPLLGQTGNVVGTVAGGAASLFGWGLFVLLVSYFIMVESSGLWEDLLKFDIPGYHEDIQRLISELSRIWNAFLRGQIIIFLLALVIYSIVLPLMGVRYAIGLAFMAALAKFLPYIGPAITWVVMALVTFFQPFKPFGLQDNPLLYTVIVVVTTLVIDQIMDSVITPRIMAKTLKVHPAAVLVVAIVASNLLGLLGVVIAAPFLATFLLFGRYITRKMFDLDPWPEKDAPPPPEIGSGIMHLPVQIWITVSNKIVRSLSPKKEKKE